MIKEKKMPPINIQRAQFSSDLLCSIANTTSQNVRLVQQQGNDGKVTMPYRLGQNQNRPCTRSRQAQPQPPSPRDSGSHPPHRPTAHQTPPRPRPAVPSPPAKTAREALLLGAGAWT